MSCVEDALGYGNRPLRVLILWDHMEGKSESGGARWGAGGVKNCYNVAVLHMRPLR